MFRRGYGAQGPSNSAAVALTRGLLVYRIPLIATRWPFALSALKVVSASRLLTRRPPVPGVTAAMAFTSAGVICKGSMVRLGLVAFVIDQTSLALTVRQPATMTLVRLGRGLGPSCCTSSVVAAEARVSSEEPAGKSLDFRM